MRGKESRDWPPPEDLDLVYGPRQDIPDVSCMPVPAAEEELEEAGFEVRVDDEPVDSSCPAGEVAGTTPDGSTTRGGVVTIHISNGADSPGPGPGPSPHPTLEPTLRPRPPGSGTGDSTDTVQPSSSPTSVS